MKRDFDDELNRPDGARGRSRARQSGRGLSGDSMRGRDSYSEYGYEDENEEYYLDDDYGMGDYDNIDSGMDQPGMRQPAYERERRPAGNAGTGAGTGAGAGRPAQNPGGRAGAGRQAQNAGGGAGTGRPAGNAGSGAGAGRPVQNPGGGAGAGRPVQNPGGGAGAGRPVQNPGGGAGAGRPIQNPGGGAGTGRPVQNPGGGAGTGRPVGSTGSGGGSVRSSVRQNARNEALSGVSGAGRGADNGTRPTAGSRSALQAAKKKKRKRIIIMAVAEVLTLACIFAYAYVARIMNSFQRPEDYNVKDVKNEVLTPKQKEHMKGYWTIAVFGVDSRDGNVNKGTNADVIMVCNINQDTGEIKLVSVFRDTYLNTDDKNSTYNKINSAYANGGPKQAVAALNRNLDLDIEDYVTFNWKAVADGINMLGGVDMEISKAEFYYINSFITETVEKTGVPSVHLKKAGNNHLDGVQAVAYGRLRLMDTDYARTERQRKVIEKAFAKAKQADLGLLNRILLMEVEQIGTNLTFTDFTNMILDLSKYHIGETGGFPFARGDMKMGKKGDCVIPQTLESNVKELHKFLFEKENYQPSSTVTKISAKIMADSGMYKQGNSVDHVSTDDGYVPKETTKAYEEESEEESEATSEGESEIMESETDEFGDPIVTKPAETKPGESKETKAGETRPGSDTTKPGESSAEEPGHGATKPDTTKPDVTKPGSDETKATGPGETDSPVVHPSPGETTTSGNEVTGPGETTAARETTAADTVPEVPGGPGSTTGAVEQPGNANDNEDVSVVAPPPAA